MSDSIAIVTDSTSDIEPSRGVELGITVVPLFVVFGDRSYKDYVELSRADFYEKLVSEKTLPTTSQPTAAMFEEAFREPVQAGRPVLCIVLSSKVSGTINAAQTAAKSFPDAKIVVYDSESAAGGLQLLVMRARELAMLGRSVDQICETLDRERKTQRLYACLADLSHVQRTGRIGRAQAAIGTLMKIVPVLRFKDGAVEAEAQVRTFARAQETMLDLGIAATPDPANARYVVLHTHAPAAAAAARDRLRSKLGGVEPKSLEIVEAGPVIATHAGPGAVGLAVSQQ